MDKPNTEHFCSHILEATLGEDEARGVRLVVICNLTTERHLILHTDPLMTKRGN